jgi:septal ring factor EnvC (AmiA/AmiB activator)
MSETSETVTLRCEVAHAVDEAMCGYDPDVLRGLVLRLGAAVLTALPEMAPSAAATESRDRIIAALTRRAEEAESKADALRARLSTVEAECETASERLGAVTLERDTLRAAIEAWADARAGIGSRVIAAQAPATERYDAATRSLLAAIGRAPVEVTP